MATPKRQRIGIWIIAVVMTVGAIGTYFVIILANNNDQTDYEESQKQAAAQQQQQEEYKKSLQPIAGYTNEPFDAASVTTLQVTDLKVGDGKEATKDSTVSANYTGWTADGVIFDSTNKNGTTTPIEFSLQSVIKGWTEGVSGMKAGGIRKLVIPTDMAYGENAASLGYPAGPLTFIVEVVEVK